MQIYRNVSVCWINESNERSCLHGNYCRRQTFIPLIQIKANGPLKHRVLTVIFENTVWFHRITITILPQSSPSRSFCRTPHGRRGTAPDALGHGSFSLLLRWRRGRRSRLRVCGWRAVRAYARLRSHETPRGTGRKCQRYERRPISRIDGETSKKSNPTSSFFIYIPEFEQVVACTNYLRKFHCSTIGTFMISRDVYIENISISFDVLINLYVFIFSKYYLYNCLFLVYLILTNHLTVFDTKY